MDVGGREWEVGNGASDTGGDSTSEVVEALRAEDDTFSAPLDSTLASPPLPTPHSLLPHLSDLDQPATTVEDWIAQIESSIVQITEVRVETTETGLQVILETADGSLEVPETRLVGNALIAEIPNVVLALPEEDSFEQFNPVEGIALVSVTGLPSDRVRVSITGTNAPPEAQVSTEASNLVLSVVPGAEGTAGAEDDAIQVVVTGEQEDSYRVERATTATRTDTPIRDIPASIQVVPQEVIRDQGANSIRETLRNVSGVTFGNSAGNRLENFNIRGFRGNEFLNGFRDDFFSARTQRDLANIERIEVLKGPASVLFGQAAPSGIINYVTEQPLLEPYYDLSFTAGSFDFYRPTIDLSGPLTEDRRLAYRLNFAYENDGSFRDRAPNERYFIAPTLTYQFSDDTALTLEVTYLDDARPIDNGLVVLSNNQIADIPISRVLGTRTRQDDFTETRATLGFEHRFTPNLALRSNLRYTRATEGAGATLQISGPSPADDRNFPLRDFTGEQFYEGYTFQNDLIAEFNTGEIEHTVLLGLELARQSGSFSGAFRSAGTIDIFNPNYDFTFGEFENYTPEAYRNNSFGIYLQDQISLLDNLILVLGGRFDALRQETTVGAASTETEAEAFSPRVGIVYQPIPDISLYASYSRSFTPVSGRSVSGDTFDPQRGTGYEVGIKTEFLTNRLSSTLAFYNTTLSNILTTDLDNPDFSIQVGEQRSRGIELDIAGEILPGWNLIATYAYTDAEVTEDNTFEAGNPLPNVPEHSASLWTTYEIQQGSLAGLGFGAGVFFVGNRQGDLNNSFEVPSYTRTDAAIYYNRDNLRVALNFKNLFDIRYFEGALNRNSVIPGAPFTVLGTISWQF